MAKSPKQEIYEVLIRSLTMLAQNTQDRNLQAEAAELAAEFNKRLAREARLQVLPAESAGGVAA